MSSARFEGFSPGLFGFLSGLIDNNNKQWFDEHRDQYHSEVLGPIKNFASELGPILRMLNEQIETEPRVGRTISRINNDIRFHKNRPPYRPVIYVAFPRRGQKWWNSALLYTGIYRGGVSVGFYPGDHRQLRTGPIQERIKKNMRLFQRYLDERSIGESYWELSGGEDGSITKWPLPKTANRWVELDGFTVGEHFPSTDRVLSKRTFLDRVQKVFLDLYPLWLFASSDHLKADLELYRDNVASLSRPLTKSAK